MRMASFRELHGVLFFYAEHLLIKKNYRYVLLNKEMEKQMEEESKVLDNYKVIEDCLCIRMPEEVDHHRSEEICKNADHFIRNPRWPMWYLILKIPGLWTAQVLVL